MARLHRYSRNSSNNGYHLKGWTKNSGNTTLQVRYPCELLFDWLGYDTGDHIPADLITLLLSSNLLYTLGEGNAVDEDPDWTPGLEAVSEELTDDQRQRLLGFVREYDGPRHKFVNQLKSEVDSGEKISDDARLSSYTSSSQNWQACIDSTSRGADESLHQIADQFFGSGSLTDEAESILQGWEFESNVDSDAFAELPHTESSVRLFHDYPGPVHSVDVTERAIVYVLTLPDTDEQEPWPKFVVNHYSEEIIDEPNDEENELLFKIQMPVFNLERISSSYIQFFDSIVHSIVVMNGNAVLWQVGLMDSSIEGEASMREEFEDHLEEVLNETVVMMEYLTGEKIAESLNEIKIEFEYESS